MNIVQTPNGLQKVVFTRADVQSLLITAAETALSSRFDRRSALLSPSPRRPAQSGGIRRRWVERARELQSARWRVVGTKLIGASFLAGQAGVPRFSGSAQPRVAQITAAERCEGVSFSASRLPRRRVIFVTPSVARRRDFTSAV